MRARLFVGDLLFRIRGDGAVVVKSSVPPPLSHLVPVEGALSPKGRMFGDQFVLKATAIWTKLDPYATFARHESLTKLRLPVPFRNSALLVEISRHPPPRPAISARWDHVVLAEAADFIREPRHCVRRDKKKQSRVFEVDAFVDS
jgi:hypothetical protein